MGYDGVKDALVYGLLASECRYIRGETDGDAEGPEILAATDDHADEGPEERVPAIPSEVATEVGNGGTQDEFWTF